MAAEHSRHAVMLCKTLVEERAIGANQFEDAELISQHVIKEEFRFPPHRLPKIVVKIGKQPHVGCGRVEIPQMQPLPGKVLRERARATITQHPSDMLFENLRS